MPVLEDSTTEVGDETPTAFYVGGEETGAGGTPTPPTPDFQIAPNHAWWAAGYSGSGPLLDTGTTGGIPLDTTLALFTDGMFSEIPPTYGSYGVLVNASESPDFGVGDFTMVWVGTHQDRGELNSQETFFDNQLSYSDDTEMFYGLQSHYGIEEVVPKWAMSTYNADSTSYMTAYSTEHIPQYGVSSYVAMTHSGNDWALIRDNTSEDLTVTQAIVGSRTGDSTLVGGGNSTRGMAIWLGQVLTHEQIAAAAQELGYEAPPVTQSAAHLWDASTYSGSGNWIDTGATGGIDLTPTGGGLSFADGEFDSASMYDVLVNESTPADLSGDFTFLWVGRSGSATQSFFGSQWNWVAPPSPVVQATASNYVLPGGLTTLVAKAMASPNGWDYEQWKTCHQTARIPATGDPLWIAVSRADGVWAMHSSVAASVEWESSPTTWDGLGDVSGDSVNFGGANWTQGGAIWTSSLTEPEIAAAAVELGYEPPPITASAAHLWNAALYSGSGPLTDTGTTGGIDLATDIGATFINGEFTTTSYEGLYNFSETPQVGTDDMTMLWVGRIADPEVAGFYIANTWDYISGWTALYLQGEEVQVDVGSDQGAFMPDGGSNGLFVPKLEPGLNYLALTRQGQVVTLFRAGTSTVVPTNSVYENPLGDVTGDAVILGAKTTTIAAAFWVGQALTEAEIEAAAIELGYTA